MYDSLRSQFTRLLLLIFFFSDDAPYALYPPTRLCLVYSYFLIRRFYSDVHFSEDFQKVENYYDFVISHIDLL